MTASIPGARPLRERLRDYFLLMRLDRPIGSLLLLWPALWALWLAAEGTPRLLHIVVFVVGVLVMRSAGCVINDFADRDFDPHVERTRDRPLAARRVTSREALAVFVALAALAFGLVCLLDPLAIALSFVGIALAMTYPFNKRFTHLPQLHLGLAFGWAVPMAFAAEVGGLPPLAWLTYGVAIVWALVYDTMYAMVDRDDDLRIGVKSSAILFGARDRAWVAGFQVVVMAGLVAIGLVAGLGAAYFAALVAGAALFVYQQHLIRQRDRAGCFRAFLNNNWFGLAIFAGIVLGLPGG
ncbi:MAG: 4-hydroxybenzoate octaprenyltransferase [Ectothiorhodospiraceae bacterium]|nr:4-hydroxybenzoate octaprenyltransferase [Chromatiales bacterium]MCP5153571.1 4-hydroxybenzoate octaprenyltransferase [Ectothiorhodospiraceae bacterium]